MEEKVLLEDTGKYLSFDVDIVLSGTALLLFLLEFLLGCQWLGAVSFKKPALRGDVLVLFQTPNLDVFLSLLTKSAVLFQI